jgi:hypothetical protein
MKNGHSQHRSKPKSKNMRGGAGSWVAFAFIAHAVITIGGTGTVWGAMQNCITANPRTFTGSDLKTDVVEACFGSATPQSTKHECKNGNWQSAPACQAHIDGDGKTKGLAGWYQHGNKPWQGVAVTGPKGQGPGITSCWACVVAEKQTGGEANPSELPSQSGTSTSEPSNGVTPPASAGVSTPPSSAPPTSLASNNNNNVTTPPKTGCENETNLKPRYPQFSILKCCYGGTTEGGLTAIPSSPKCGTDSIGALYAGVATKGCVASSMAPNPDTKTDPTNGAIYGAPFRCCHKDSNEATSMSSAAEFGKCDYDLTDTTNRDGVLLGSSTQSGQACYPEKTSVSGMATKIGSAEIKLDPGIRSRYQPSLLCCLKDKAPDQSRGNYQALSEKGAGCSVPFTDSTIGQGTIYGILKTAVSLDQADKGTEKFQKNSEWSAEEIASREDKGGDDDCKFSATIGNGDGGKGRYKCNGTKKKIEEAQTVTGVTTALAQTYAQIQGQQAQSNASSAGGQVAAVEGAASTARSAADMQTALGAVQLYYAAMLEKKASEHRANANAIKKGADAGTEITQQGNFKEVTRADGSKGYVLSDSGKNGDLKNTTYGEGHDESEHAFIKSKDIEKGGFSVGKAIVDQFEMNTEEYGSMQNFALPSGCETNRSLLRGSFPDGSSGDEAQLNAIASNVLSKASGKKFWSNVMTVVSCKRAGDAIQCSDPLQQGTATLLTGSYQELKGQIQSCDVRIDARAKEALSKQRIANRDIKNIGKSAAAEQNNMASSTGASATSNLMGALTQFINASLNRDTASNLEKSAETLRNVEVMATSTPGPYQFSANDPNAVLANNTSDYGDLSGASTSAATVEKPAATPSGGVPNSPTFDDPLAGLDGGPVNNPGAGAPPSDPFQKDQGLAGGGGGGGGGGGLSSGSTPAATEASNQEPGGPTLAQNRGGSSSVYEGGAAPRPGGGGGGSNSGGNPELASLLAQFMPKEKDYNARPTILDFGGGTPQGRAPAQQTESLLDRTADLFERVSAAYVRRTKGGNLGPQINAPGIVGSVRR